MGLIRLVWAHAVIGLSEKLGVPPAVIVVLYFGILPLYGVAWWWITREDWLPPTRAVGGQC
jgi:hypothetical protein